MKETVTKDFDILYAIWFLACNDKNPLMTYTDTAFRLGLTNDSIVKTLVHSREELFRKKIHLSQLNDWKYEMLQGKKLPFSLQNIRDISIRNSEINNLTINDVFSSQFRPEITSISSTTEITSWGIQHIERLRGTFLEEKKEKIKFLTNFLLPILSTLVAIVAVASSFYVQHTANNNQVLLKKYEVQFKPKQEGYSNFMNEINQTFNAALDKETKLRDNSLSRMESSFYSLEPFLPEFVRDSVVVQIHEFSGFCLNAKLSDSNKLTENLSDSFFLYKLYFRENLYNNLFRKGEVKYMSMDKLFKDYF